MATSQAPGETSSSNRSSADEQGTIVSSVVGLDNAIQKLKDLSASKKIQSIFSILGQDSKLHIVGGTVREILSGREPGDIDLASQLPPQEAERRLVSAGLRVIETAPQHGTLTLVWEKENIELTTFRVPGPHGQNNFSDSIETDLSGRDFTINALAWDIGRNELVDPCNGYADIRNKYLRTVGQAEERFKEDPLRLMRMVRFGAGCNRKVDGEALLAAQRLHTLIENVSVERIQQELRRILISDHAAAALRQLHEIGILGLILPEIIPSIGCEQNEFHTQDVFEHTLSVVERCPKDATLRLIALFHDIGKPGTLSVDQEGRRHFYEHEMLSEKIAREVMKRLKFSNADSDHIATVVKLHMRPLECGPPGVRRIIRDTGEYFEDWRTFKQADKTPIFGESELQKRIAAFDALVDAEKARLAALQGKRIVINGDDLIALGYRPGKLLGQMLNELEEMVIEAPEKNTREQLLAYAASKQESGVHSFEQSGITDASIKAMNIQNIPPIEQVTTSNTTINNSLNAGVSAIVQNQKVSSKLPSFLLLMVTVVVVVMLFRPQTEHAQSKDQLEYQQWLSKTQDSLRSKQKNNVDAASVGAATSNQTSSKKESIPKLTLTIITPSQIPTKYELNSENHSATNEKEYAARILRLLELVEVSGILNVNNPGLDITNNSSTIVQLQVTSSERSFNATVREEDIKNNVQALLLLRLFKEFALFPPPVIAQSAPIEDVAVLSENTETNISADSFSSSSADSTEQIQP